MDADGRRSGEAKKGAYRPETGRMWDVGTGLLRKEMETGIQQKRTKKRKIGSGDFQVVIGDRGGGVKMWDPFSAAIEPGARWPGWREHVR